MSVVETVRAELSDIEGLSQQEKAKMVTKSYVLAKLVDVTEGVGVWATAKPREILQAIKMLGEVLKLFVQHKKVDIDVKGLINGMPNEALKEIIDVEILEDGASKNSSPARLSNGNKCSCRV
jgi:hypothetical protein